MCVAFSAYTYSTSVKEVGELLIGKDSTKQKKRVRDRERKSLSIAPF